MSYVLERFGTTDLPGYETQTDVGLGGPLRTATTELSSGGAFDSLGSGIAPRGAGTVQLIGELVATTAAALETAFFALRARRGARDRLYRRVASGEVEWITARLVDMPGTATPDNVLYQAVELHWLLTDPVWAGRHHGAGWTLDNGIYLDTAYYLDEADVFALPANATTDCTVTNAGNAPVSAIRLTITAGSASITAVTVTGPGPTEWTYSATITAGHSLVVDTGALSVTNNNVEDYAHWAFTSNQALDEWLLLRPGPKSVHIALTGGGTGSQAIFDFSDGWE